MAPWAPLWFWFLEEASPGRQPSGQEEHAVDKMLGVLARNWANCCTAWSQWWEAKAQRPPAPRLSIAGTGSLLIAAATQQQLAVALRGGPAAPASAQHCTQRGLSSGQQHSAADAERPEASSERQAVAESLWLSSLWLMALAEARLDPARPARAVAEGAAVQWADWLYCQENCNRVLDTLAHELEAAVQQRGPAGPAGRSLSDWEVATQCTAFASGCRLASALAGWVEGGALAVATDQEVVDAAGLLEGLTHALVRSASVCNCMAGCVPCSCFRHASWQLQTPLLGCLRACPRTAGRSGRHSSCARLPLHAESGRALAGAQWPAPAGGSAADTVGSVSSRGRVHYADGLAAAAAVRQPRMCGRACGAGPSRAGAQGA